MDTGATYHIYSERERFVSFERLDRGMVSFGDDRTCHTEGISTIRNASGQIGWLELKNRVISVDEECDFDWSFGGTER